MNNIQSVANLTLNSKFKIINPKNKTKKGTQIHACTIRSKIRTARHMHHKLFYFTKR